MLIQKTGLFSCRIVAIWHDGEGSYLVYVTAAPLVSDTSRKSGLLQ